MNTFCVSTVSVSCTCFHSSGVKSVFGCSTSKHRAFTKLHHHTACKLFLDFSPSLSHCCNFPSVVLLQSTLTQPSTSCQTAINMCCATSATLNNTVHKMWKCAVSLDSLNELAGVSCHVCIDIQVFRNCLRVY